MVVRPAAGGGRWVEVAPGRLRGWLDGFAGRHGRPDAVALGGDAVGIVRLTAPDGAVAECHVPFPPLVLASSSAAERTPDDRPARTDPRQAAVRRPAPAAQAPSRPEGEPSTPSGSEDGLSSRTAVPGGAGAAPDGPGLAAPAAPDAAAPDLVELLIAHANRSRRVGVLLVRLGGHAAGVFDGDRLVASKVGARHVQGRTAAGGWSQQRFARRRTKQAKEALRAAADVAARVLTPHLPELDAVVLGGDRRAIEALRDDPRLAGVFALETPPFLTVPDPRLAVLQAAPALFRAVRIRVLDEA
jgi:Peptide chain release factor 1 (eRF1)